VDVDLPAAAAVVPPAVRAFLREAGRRIEHFQATSRSPAFVPSDHAGAYPVLKALADANLAPGNRFCEWGSGFGVVACLATMLDFDAYGIEIEPALVDAARELAADFDLPVQFARDSFIPPGGESCAEDPLRGCPAAGFAWLTTDAGGAEDELGLAADDFDVIFAYPWPDEEGVIEALFLRYAAVGAVLVTYRGCEEFRVQRKTAGRRQARMG
jgi:hypothetical protein